MNHFKLYVDDVLVGEFLDGQIAFAHEAFEAGFKRHLRDGIRYHHLTPLVPYVVAADASPKDKAIGIAKLYEVLFNARVEEIQ